MAFTAREIAQIEKMHPEGLSSRQILDLLATHGEPLTEATLRKYVQLGLLPRSRRVGQKGKHRGSRGIYPVEVIRRVDEVRKAMTSGETLEELARAAHAVRAKLSTVRVSMEEALSAAENDLTCQALDRRTHATLRGRLASLEKEGKTWLRTMESFTDEVQGAARPDEARANGARARGNVRRTRPDK